jgi:hypothetical protein
MASARFQHSEHNHAVFYHHVAPSDIVIISAHVDDLTIIAPNEQIMKVLISKIKEHVQTKKSGDLHWILGIEIKHNLEEHMISLTQRVYIDQILSCYVFENIKPLALPIDPHLQLSTDQCLHTPDELAVIRNKPFYQALGALIYASVTT